MTDWEFYIQVTKATLEVKIFTLFNKCHNNRNAQTLVAQAVPVPEGPEMAGNRYRRPQKGPETAEKGEHLKTAEHKA